MKVSKIEQTNSLSVFCVGNKLPYDHPKVYFKLDTQLGAVDCPYCGKKFELKY